MDDTQFGKPHEKRQVKLLEAFGNAKAGTVVEADICLVCGVRVAAKQLGYNDHGSWMVPSELIDRERLLAGSLKESRCKVVQIAAPSLPFMVSTRRLVKDVLDVRLFKRCVQTQEALPHSLRFLRADAHP